mgnify:CR=1 FL=1
MRRNTFKKGSIVVLLLLIFTVSLASAEEKKYPPYPDVWDWHELSTRGFGMYRLQHGDILIEYRIRSSQKKKKMGVYAVTFFGRKMFAGEDAWQIVERARKTSPYMKKYKAISPDGIWNIDYVVTSDLRCYGGPNRAPYKITNTKTGEERIFTIFRLLDKAETFYVPEFCEYPGRSITYKVKSVSGDFFFLEDNSFLFQAEDTGNVIRFDSNLKSKSNIVEDRFFLIENDGSGWAGITKLTGREYDDDGDQQVVNDLYHYLKNKRKGRK